MSSRFRMVRLDGTVDRSSFSCGQSVLDLYFRTQASQDMRRRLATCFVSIATETGDVAGYYTLSSAGIPVDELPQEIAKKLGRYPSIPSVRIGRLAVDRHYQGIGLGGSLLADALDRVLRAEPACYALVVDAKDDAAVAFYRHHGFLSFTSQPRILFLPVATAAMSMPK